jgi:NACHT domain
VGAEFQHEDRQSCTDGTRVSLLGNLLSWATADDSFHVFWLNGMAGTGKTTVMETFCRYLDREGLLGASFFCSIKSRRAVHAIFPSIARTLARNHPRFHEKLVDVLTSGKCSDPLGMNLKDQYERLILGPAEEAFSTDSDEITVISIDALDECDDEEGTQIKMLLKTILDRKPNVRLRFFVTSRPDRRIRESFERRHHSSLRLHDIEDHIIQADIALYLRDQLGRVEKLKEYYDSTGKSWPPSEIEIIVKRAGKLFVYASTMVKYITNFRGDPVERLQEVSALQVIQALESPVAVPLEKLYELILSEALDGMHTKEAARIWSCLSILVSTHQPLSIRTYAKIIDVRVDLIRTAFGSLHSVIIVPPELDRHISIYHASFQDYLVTRTIEMKAAHLENASRCFRLMNSELRLGISGAITSYSSNNDQSNNGQRLNLPDLIPAHLKYACRAWGKLVLQSIVGPTDLIVDDIREKIENFLCKKFLYWLEVLSAMDDISYVSPLLYHLSQVCQCLLNEPI